MSCYFSLVKFSKYPHADAHCWPARQGRRVLRYCLWSSRSVHPLRKAIYKYMLHCLARQGNCQIILCGCLQLPVENCAK